MRRYRARKKAVGLRAVMRWAERSDSPATFSDHRWLDARSLALHCAIVRKIERDPNLLEVGRRNLAAWEARRNEPLPRSLQDWKRLLRMPWPELAAAMTGIDERSVALRQSSPFAGVLTAAERKRIYDAFRA